MIEVAPYSKEPTLFRISLAVAIVLWLLLMVGTVGIALFYVLLAGLIYLFAQSGFVAYLKGNAVEVSSRQYPLLHGHYLACCERLQIGKPPQLYVLQSEGMVNALAARFLNRNYVVLFSGVVDALEKHPESLRFYMGHELCHVVRGHLKWSLLLWPAKLLPLLGPAYARAQESSCDRYGLACCANPLDAIRAMAAIASGSALWSRLNVRAFRDQCEETGHFWMAFHELTSAYPWLCKRVGRVAAWVDGTEETFPRRHALAWLLAAFVPNLGMRGGGNPVTLILVVAVIGILAAVAIPAYQDYTVRARVAQSLDIATTISQGIAEHVETHRAVPGSLGEIGVPDDYAEGAVEGIELGPDGQFVITYRGAGVIEGSTIEFVPYMDSDNAIQWDCMGGSMPPRLRPSQCRVPAE